MRGPKKTLAEFTSEALELANAAERTKQAELAVLREVTPSVETEIAQLLRKTAASLREASSDITYDDLNRYMEGRL